MSVKTRRRLVYAAAFAAILILEVIIALFVRDRFIRPYGGDVLVTVLICCFLRIFLPERVRLLPVYVFLFAVCVEIGQYFDFVSLLGLDGNAFFSILLGSTFSFADIVCYGVGCVLFSLAEALINKRIRRAVNREKH